jgi:putative heme-binding domain-containing protein
MRRVDPSMPRSALAVVARGLGALLAAWAGGGELRAAPPQTLPGWRIELLAEHPVLRAPAVVCAAPDGRVFVGEDPMDVSTEFAHETRGRVVVLHSDGRATTFADGLHAPFGMQYLEGKLYVLHNPKLSVFSDGGSAALDRTDLIEQTLPEPWVSNWNDHVPSNFRLGMDGYFHVSIGDKGLFGMIGRDGRRVDLRGGGTIRLRPDGSGLEITARGTRNTLDIAITPEDELFTYDNTDEHDWMGRFTHMVDGGVYGYPYDFVPRRGYTLWKLADYGPGAACGAVCYNDDAWPEAFRGNVFIADHVQRNVRRVVIEREGATFKEVSNENLFIEPASDFRPVGLAETHDGRGLLITDWVNGGYKEKLDVGRLWRLTRADGTNAAPVPDWYASAAAGKDSGASLEALLSGFSHPRRAVRLTAQRACARLVAQTGLSSATLAPIERLLEDPGASAVARWHALWALDAIDGGQHAREAVLRIAANTNGVGVGLTRQALGQLGERRVREAVPILTAQLRHADASIRFRAATALRRIGDPAAVPGLLAALNDGDGFVRFAVFTALNSLGRAQPSVWPSVVQAFSAADPRVREAAGYAVRETYDAALVEVLAALAGDPARGVGARQEALRFLAGVYRAEPPWTGKWWGTHPALAKPPARTLDWEGTPRVFRALAAALADAEAPLRLAAVVGLQSAGATNALPALRGRFEPETDLAVKRALVETFGTLRDTESGSLLARMLREDRLAGGAATRSAVEGALRGALVTAAGLLGAAWQEAGVAHTAAAAREIAAELEQLLRVDLAPELLPGALEALGHFRLTSTARIFAGFARHREEAVRNAAFGALAKLDPSAAWAVVQPLLDDPMPVVRRGAVKCGGTLKLRDAVPLLLAAYGREETRGEALVALTAVPDVRALDAYLTGFSVEGWAQRDRCARAVRAIAGEALPLLEARAGTLAPSALDELRKIYAQDEVARRGPLFTSTREPVAVETYARFALEHPGDPWRGQQLFFDPGGVACIRCHQVAGHGGSVGPDLTLAGKAFARDVIIESILYPNKAVREGYYQADIRTKDGEEYTGAIKAETADRLTLLTLDNRTLEIPVAQISDRHITVQSMMPEGLQAALTLEQFADLVAYCVALRGDPRQFEAKAAPSGFTALFHGQDLAGWAEQPGATGAPAPGTWRADGGVLDSGGGTNVIWHHSARGNFELRFEWRWAGVPEVRTVPGPVMEAGAAGSARGPTPEVCVLDAGSARVWLRGGAQHAVELTCAPSGSGACHTREAAAGSASWRSRAPHVRADRPVGQWNEMTIRIEDGRGRVVLNRMEILGETALPGLPEPGPIGFSAPRGVLHVRHVWVRDL